jgi:hypothetical protein
MQQVVGDNNTSSSGSSSSPSFPLKKDFVPLFPATYTTRMGEMALCLWDFLDASSSLTGDLTFTLGEIIKCIEKPKTNAPS